MQRGRKVVVVGPSGSGKSTFFKRCTDPHFSFNPVTSPTRVIDAKIVARFVDDKLEKFVLVDTVGNALFGVSDSAGGIFEDIRIVLCFFDLSLHKSWENLIVSDRFDNIRTFVEFRHRQITDVDFIVIGGKADKETKVVNTEIEDFISSATTTMTYGREDQHVNLFRLSRKFFKCSAATGEGIEEILDYIAAVLVADEKKPLLKDKKAVYLLENEDVTGSTHECCNT